MNKRDTDLLDMLPALEDGSLKYTPISICRDMVNLIPDDVFNKDAKFLDIACKSGRFLREIMYRLMESNQMQSGSAEGRDKKKYNLAIESERKEYIMREQLFGLSLNDTVVNIARRNLYGTLDSGIDNIVVLKENVRRTLKEKLGNMQFDVVVGNPPYNNDIYLDFVTFGHNLARKYDCWITPAKWQVKGGDKNKQFREDVVPYMSKIVYYKYSRDIFDIWEHDGISYYLMDKERHSTKIITGKCSNKSFEWKAYTSTDCILLSQIHKNIISKAMNNNISIEKNLEDYIRYSDLKYNGEETRVNDNYIEMIGGNKVTGYIDINKLTTNYKLDKYKISNATMVGYWIAFDKTNNKTLGIVDYNIIKPYQVPKGSYPVIRYFDTEDEAISFKSYMKTKLVAFLFYCGIDANTINSSFYRYIPEQESYDHIFTDMELYKKYSLSEEEINIIESIIKERK